jgi:hypothetical protein
MRCLWFGMSRCKQAYIEYESQSQGIRSQSLPKQKRIAIAGSYQEATNNVFSILPEARSNSCISVT